MAERSPESNRDSRDIRGTLGALIFIVIGGVCWWDVRDAPSAQAVVFPRTVIILMVAFCVLLILRNLIGRAAPETVPASGSTVRRVALLVTMIVATLIMPYVGFVIAAFAAYLAIMAIAMYERWTGLRLVVYPAVGVVVVVGFYFVFQHVFQVPLPAPSGFELPF